MKNAKKIKKLTLSLPRFIEEVGGKKLSKWQRDLIKRFKRKEK